MYGTHVAFPSDATVYCAEAHDSVPCNRLLCDPCASPVKHVEGVQQRGRWSKAGLSVLYDSTDPDVWKGDVVNKPAYRLYHCRCRWFSTPGGSATSTRPTSTTGLAPAIRPTIAGKANEACHRRDS